jgi:predicted nucleic acid-binding protein
MRRRDVLLDTGPLVAVLDTRDQWHERCVATWPDVIIRCLTTEAVVTEACHLVSRGGGPAYAALDFLLAAGIPVLTLETAGQRRAATLMKQYGTVPMDFADASLVTLAEALSVPTVFTTDRRGFSTYRALRGARFTLLPNG